VNGPAGSNVRQPEADAFQRFQAVTLQQSQPVRDDCVAVLVATAGYLFFDKLL
jgi:hypothetical protein